MNPSVADSKMRIRYARFPQKTSRLSTVKSVKKLKSLVSGNTPTIHPPTHEFSFPVPQPVFEVS